MLDVRYELNKLLELSCILSLKFSIGDPEVAEEELVCLDTQLCVLRD
jgi:hypothetical protein